MDSGVVTMGVGGKVEEGIEEINDDGKKNIKE